MFVILPGTYFLVAWTEQPLQLRPEGIQAAGRRPVGEVGKEHNKLRSDMEGAGARVDRVEREMDYTETKNPPKPCVKAADKMVEQDVVVRERKKEEFFELSGKSGELSFDSWSCHVIMYFQF